MVSAGGNDGQRLRRIRAEGWATAAGTKLCFQTQKPLVTILCSWRFSEPWDSRRSVTPIRIDSGDNAPDYVIQQQASCGVWTTCLSLSSTATTRTSRSDANDNEDKVGHDGGTIAKPRLHHPAHKAKAHGGTLGRARYAFGHTRGPSCHPCPTW
jgi:hypothetical protein